MDVYGYAGSLAIQAAQLARVGDCLSMRRPQSLRLPSCESPSPLFEHGSAFRGHRCALLGSNKSRLAAEVLGLFCRRMGRSPLGPSPFAHRTRRLGDRSAIWTLPFLVARLSALLS